MAVREKFNLWKYICMLLIVFIFLDYALDFAFDEFIESHYYNEEEEEEKEDFSFYSWRMDKFL